MQEQTSIRITKSLLQALKTVKENKGESYEEVIWDLIEPYLELSEDAKKDIEKSREEYKRGEFITLEELNKAGL